MLAPAGAPTSEKVSVLVGMSGSVAVAVNVRRLPQATALGPGFVSVGPRFTSFTWMVISLYVVLLILSITTVIVLPVLPCAPVGVQLNTPVEGLMLAPAGAPSSENVSVLGGMSESVAAAVKL